jgi:hypothetical protein
VSCSLHSLEIPSFLRTKEKELSDAFKLQTLANSPSNLYTRGQITSWFWSLAFSGNPTYSLKPKENLSFDGETVAVFRQFLILS